MTTLVSDEGRIVMNTRQLSSITIGDRSIGPGKPCFVIGEAGLNHNGNLDSAKRLIDIAVSAGCDCVKFQRRTVSELTTDDLLDKEDNRFPTLGNTYREIRERHEFSADEFKELVGYAGGRGIICLCTPFDIPAVDFLEQFNLPAYKVASHSVTNLPLLQYLSTIGKPIIMSSGMCTFEELSSAVEVFRAADVPLAILHCVSAYPTPPSHQNMKMIGKLGDRFGVPVGYSGHEIGMLPTLLSVGLGATIVERHITESHGLEGFDHKLSLNGQELEELVQGIRSVESMMGSGEKSVSDTEQITRDKYHVSMITCKPIAAGHTVQRDDIVFKNPGTGLPPSMLPDVLGKRTNQAVDKDVLLSLDMLDS